MKKGVLLILLLLLIPCVIAEKDSIKLLALTESGGKHGVIVDLNLELKQGKERVFLETFPLTKIATQVSMRFAQQVACSEFDMYCSDSDFFFTISAMPGIVGGPSAGAASAVLTAALMKGFPIRQDVAITGTINSGGIIGLVGGLDYKIKGAAEKNLSLVLIPKGSRHFKTDGKVIDLIELGNSLNITVVEVATLDEAFEQFTNTTVIRSNESIVLDPKYVYTMKAVGLDLCKRNDEINNLLETLRKDLKKDPSDNEKSALEYTKKGRDAYEKDDFYSSASFCFRSNVMLKREYFKLRDYSKGEVNEAVKVINEKINKLDSAVSNYSIDTISDLQAFMAVKERLSEAKHNLENAKNEADPKKAANILAYAEERYYSGVAWAKFFGLEGKTFNIDKTKLKSSCTSKISEAEERYNYVKSFLKADLSQTRNELDDAYQEMNNEHYIMCLFKAAKAKAEIDVILSAVGVSQQRVQEYIDLKLEIARFALFKSYKKDVFPMIGYSYYEYAKSLKNIDHYAALLFSEYALKLGHLFHTNKNSIMVNQ
jgi:predicted S18 family serine protease